jgi:DNA polymerase III subunit epsilon
MNIKRQIILDTETTGLSPADGHKIIEIGAIELIDRTFTGNNFHKYINPGDVEIEEGAFKVHGISKEFLKDKPLFAEILPELLVYIGNDSELIIHNAPFDIGFLNYEIKLLDKRAKEIADYAGVIDTLLLARKKHPGKPNNLDALCKRYKVDLSERNLHGALLDARLLAEVFLRMTQGQMTLLGDDLLLNKTNKKAQQRKFQRDPNQIIPIIYADDDVN